MGGVLLLGLSLFFSSEAWAMDRGNPNDALSQSTFHSSQTSVIINECTFVDDWINETAQEILKSSIENISRGHSGWNTLIEIPIESRNPSSPEVPCTIQTVITKLHSALIQELPSEFHLYIGPERDLKVAFNWKKFLSPWSRSQRWSIGALKSTGRIEVSIHLRFRQKS
jgi:hypothetical protein